MEITLTYIIILVLFWVFPYSMPKFKMLQSLIAGIYSIILMLYGIDAPLVGILTLNLCIALFFGITMFNHILAVREA